MRKFDNENERDKLMSLFNKSADSIRNLKQQLAEKDAEIERMKELDKATSESLYASRELYEKEKTKRWALEKQLKTNTHQVCEKIREWAKDWFGGEKDYKDAIKVGLYLEVRIDEFLTFLDKIENMEE